MRRFAPFVLRTIEPCLRWERKAFDNIWNDIEQYERTLLGELCFALFRWTTPGKMGRPAGLWRNSPYTLRWLWWAGAIPASGPCPKEPRAPVKPSSRWRHARSRKKPACRFA